MFDAIQYPPYVHPDLKKQIIAMLQPRVPRRYKNRRGLNPVPFARPLILCIEDNPIYLELRKAVLEAQGYEVLGVTSTIDALVMLRTAPVSVRPELPALFC